MVTPNRPAGLLRAIALATVALLTGLANPAEAGQWANRQARKATCPPNKAMARVEHKTCPATKRRPTIVLVRACCRNARAKVACKPFAPCPVRSPS